MLKATSKSLRHGGPRNLIRCFSRDVCQSLESVDDTSKTHHGCLHRKGGESLAGWCSNRGNIRHFQTVSNSEVVMAPSMGVFRRNFTGVTGKMGTNAFLQKGNMRFSNELCSERSFSSNSDLPAHQEIGMPSLSPTMTEGNIARWLKKEGDKVSPGEVLCEVETDKATVEMECMEDGYLAKIIRGDGSQGIQVGEVIAITVEEEEDVGKFKDYTPSKSAAAVSADTPESVSSRKRQKKSGTKKEDAKKDGTDEEVGSAEDEAAAGKSEDGEDVEMKDAEVAGDLSKEEKAEKAADSTEPSVKNIEGKSDEGQVTEAARASSLDGQEAQVEEPASGKGEEQPEENKLETGDKQTEAEVPQQTVPSGGEEQPEEKKPESGSDADLLMKNNATEEPGETKEDHREKVAEPLVTEEKKPEAGTDAELPKATNNTTERQAGKTEEPGEKPTESLVPEEKKPETGSDTELPKETIHATEEQPGETKVAGEKPAESSGQPDVLVSPVNTSTEKDVNETTPTNAGETEAKQGHENPEEKVSSEVVGVDTNGTKENQETAMHTKNQPANHDGTPDGTAHEPSAAPPVSC